MLIYEAKIDLMLSCELFCFAGYFEGGLLSALGSVVLMCMLAFSRNPEGKDDGTRFMYLNGFAFCTGKSYG